MLMTDQRSKEPGLSVSKESPSIITQIAPESRENLALLKETALDIVAC